MAAPPTLQQGIDDAGSAVRMLWRVAPTPWAPPVIESEFSGWRTEQDAWHDAVALYDLSHHMSDTVVQGPDARALLAAVSANDYDAFAVGQAKQFIPVAEDGNIITDGILLRDAAERFTLSGVPAAQNWVSFHAQHGGYDVETTTDPDSSFRWGGGGPKLFRFQIQGPAAGEVAEAVFGGPMPETKFFHAAPVHLGDRSFRALRHGMAGQAGWEFIGDGADHDLVRDALLAAGEAHGLQRVGGKAYATAGLESGWIPAPVPAIYTDPTLAPYRRFLSMWTFEGQNPLCGSYFSDRIEDYYTSPWELGYGRSLSFGHDFLGRDALLAARDTVTRRKVTLVIDPADAARTAGDDGFTLRYARDQVLVGDEMVGQTFQAASLDPVGTVLILALVDEAHAAPGTEVAVLWGDHPGYGTAPDADLGFPRLRATVQAAPFEQYARTRYRQNA